MSKIQYSSKKLDSKGVLNLVNIGIQAHVSALQANQIAAVSVISYAARSGREAAILEIANTHVKGLTGGRADLLVEFYQTFCGLRVNPTKASEGFVKFLGVKHIEEEITVKINNIDKKFPNRLAAAKEYMFWQKAKNNNVFKSFSIIEHIKRGLKMAEKSNKAYQELESEGKLPEGAKVDLMLDDDTLNLLLAGTKFESLTINSDKITIDTSEQSSNDDAETEESVQLEEDTSEAVQAA